MRVKYPFCRRCCKSRTKKEEQIYKDIGETKTNGGITTHERTYCAVCNGLLSWKSKTYGRKNPSDKCPDCKGPKSWTANRCKMCHSKYIREHPEEHYTRKIHNDDFKKRLRQRVDEIKKEMDSEDLIKQMKLKSQRRRI